MKNTLKNIVVFGASGKTGREVVQQALSNGYHVTAFVRRPTYFNVTASHFTVIEGNINNIGQVRDAIRGKDAVIITLGVSKTFHHDAEVVSGIHTIAEAMKEEKVDRMIYMSVFLAHAQNRKFSFFVRNILSRLIRKEVLDHEAKETIVQQHGKAFTIVKATRLKQHPPTGKYQHGEALILNQFLPSIATGDVANFMLRQINDDSYMNKKVFITSN